MIGDMPAISAGSYSSSSYAGIPVDDPPHAFIMANHVMPNTVRGGKLDEMISQAKEMQRKKEAEMPARRVVKVLIADPNENIPVEDCLLHSGSEKLTDATDQELFFELDIKALLEAHNQKRTKFIDKKVKDRTEYLEPAKVRDLKMVVVTVATF